MKKALLILVTVVATAMNAMGTTKNDSIVAAADSAYMNDDFLNAASLYNDAINQLGPSAERYYNLGNAYYRSGLLGMSIVSYERALRLDPSNQDVRDNLEFVNSQITDRVNTNASFTDDVILKALAIASPNTWAWLAFVCFLIALGGVVVYACVDVVALRKVGFFGAGVLLIVTVLLNVLAYKTTRKVNGSHEAVVVSPSVILSTTPRQPKDRTEEAMLLHEGTKVSIVDSIPGSGDDRMWYDVKVDDSHRAWISSQAIEQI